MMEKEKMFKIEIERDNDGKWGYDKTFNVFVSSDKQVVFKKAIEELWMILRSLRARDSYREEIEEDLKNFLQEIKTDKQQYYGREEDEWSNMFDKKELEICYGFDFGNANFLLQLKKVDVIKTENSFSYIEIQE